MKYQYLGCILCGFRIVSLSDRAPFGCDNCGSSIVCIEDNLSEEAYKILRDHGQRTGSPDPEPSMLPLTEEEKWRKFQIMEETIAKLKDKLEAES